MRMEEIRNCRRDGDQVADGLEGFCLQYSKGKEGFDQLLEERAELCNCGNHLGYYTPWGFSIRDPKLQTLATVEPDNCVSVVCQSCGDVRDIQVLQAMLPPMPLNDGGIVIKLS
ncbi:MAG: hypothetical protein CL524_01115 [Aequorivita sp.]|nr:hypothetical protein [Aequorivita sp.]